MKWLKRIFKAILYVLFVPLTYFLISIVTTYITSNELTEIDDSTEYIYLVENSIHLELIFSVEQLSDSLVQKIGRKTDKNYFSFGWGDENFYLNTPEWSDLTISTAAKAMLWKSSSLIHVSQFEKKKDRWIKIPVTKAQKNDLFKFIELSFQTESNGAFKVLEGKGYWEHDDFFRSNQSYHCFYTCNSWVNEAFKTAKMPASLWTPFSFKIMDMYKN